MNKQFYSQFKFNKMGRYLTGVNGAFSGKVGSAIGSNWRNVDYMRGLSKRRKKGASELQLAQQMKFALCADQLRVIKDVLNIGFSDKKLNKITGYNAAVRLFLAEAIIGEYPSFGIDYSKMKISKGSLNPLSDVSITVISDISLTWIYDVTMLNTYADDKVMFVFYNQDKKAYRAFDQAVREDGSFSVPFGGSEGEVIHIWAFCIKRDGTAVSNSMYVGNVTITLPLAI